MQIDTLTEDDLPTLAELYRQFWSEESSLERMRATFRRLANDPSYLFLAVDQRGASRVACRVKVRRGDRHQPRA